tara:strand:- start:1221 stop:2180 length:960 start_codon:yes stop_codon:yes gene_type:complete
MNENQMGVMMRVLITGTGLVGTAYAIEAINSNDECLFVDVNPDGKYLEARLGMSTKYSYVRGDIRDLPNLIAIMQDFQPSVVVHTAGLIGSSVANPIYTGLQINIQGTINVLEAARLIGIQKFIHISTFGVYDRRLEDTTPLSEDFPRGAENPYSASKIANEHIAEAYSAQFGFPLVIIRPANVYGFGHFRGGSGGGQMLQSIVAGGIEDRAIEISAAQARSFEYIHSDDLGAAMYAAAIRDVKGPFNVGNGRIVQFEELIDAIRVSLPNLKVTVAKGERQSFVQPMDLSRANNLLDWQPKISLADGFNKYINEMKSAH